MAAMSETTLAFGELLRRLRRDAALSQEALAERSGLSRNGISDLERGLHPAPRLETVRLLADALGCVGASVPTCWRRHGPRRHPPVPQTTRDQRHW